VKSLSRIGSVCSNVGETRLGSAVFVFGSLPMRLCNVSSAWVIVFLHFAHSELVLILLCFACFGSPLESPGAS
jgi:hypothetical protein